MNLVDLLYASAERYASRRALTDVRTGRSLSYGQLAREAQRVAAFLKAQGVEAGQRIGLLAPNDLAYVPAAFGLLAAGGCLVPPGWPACRARAASRAGWRCTNRRSP